LKKSLQLPEKQEAQGERTKVKEKKGIGKSQPREIDCQGGPTDREGGPAHLLGSQRIQKPDLKFHWPKKRIGAVKRDS